MYKYKQYRFDSFPRNEKRRGECIDLSVAEFKDMREAAGVSVDELCAALGITKRRLDKYRLEGYPRFVVMYLTLRANVRSLYLASEYIGFDDNPDTIIRLMEETGLTYSNLAKVLNVSQHTVQRWVTEDRLPKYAAETLYVFLKIGQLFYVTYGTALRRRDFLPANKRFKLLPKGTKGLDGSPRGKKKLVRDKGETE
jgi:DNA-binding transcriptional regulator YiaG